MFSCRLPQSLYTCDIEWIFRLKKYYYHHYSFTRCSQAALVWLALCKIHDYTTAVVIELQQKQQPTGRANGNNSSSSNTVLLYGLSSGFFLLPPNVRVLSSANANQQVRPASDSSENAKHRKKAPVTEEAEASSLKIAHHYSLPTLSSSTCCCCLHLDAPALYLTGSHAPQMRFIGSASPPSASLQKAVEGLSVLCVPTRQPSPPPCRSSSRCSSHYLLQQ